MFTFEFSEKARATLRPVCGWDPSEEDLTEALQSHIGPIVLQRAEGEAIRKRGRALSSCNIGSTTFDLWVVDAGQHRWQAPLRSFYISTVGEGSFMPIKLDDHKPRSDAWPTDNLIAYNSKHSPLAIHTWELLDWMSVSSSGDGPTAWAPTETVRLRCEVCKLIRHFKQDEPEWQ